MNIENVKETDSGFFVNNNVYVPRDEKNRDYVQVKEWVDLGGKVEPFFSESELIESEAIDIRSTRDELVNRVSREIERLTDIGKDASDWRKYRQFLRDVPDQTNFPQNINWGTPPAEFTGK